MTSNPSSRELVEDFRAAAHSRWVKLAEGDPKTANKLFDRLTGIYVELKQRGQADLGLLLPMLDDIDPAVRLDAGALALEFASDRAERVLQETATLRGLIGFTAKMTLREWHAGRMTFPPYGKSKA